MKFQSSPVFSKERDDQDFLADVNDLNVKQHELLKLLFEVSSQDHPDNAIQPAVQQQVAKLDNMIKQQVNTRTNYSSLRSPAAELTIESSKLTFDTVIGKGGFGVVWKGTYEGHTVDYFDLGSH